MVIQVPDHLPIEVIAPESLPPDWQNFQQYPVCQERGAAWLQSQSSVLLQVPSAVVPQEKNFLLNLADKANWCLATHHRKNTITVFTDKG